jgi:hypothetical protein
VHVDETPVNMLDQFRQDKQTYVTRRLLRSADVLPKGVVYDFALAGWQIPC